MAKLKDKMENGDEAPATPAFDKPKPDYEKDPNVQARKRAAKRSGNRNSGKPVDDGVFGEAEVPKADGGIVAEAEEELAESKAEGEEAPKVEEETPVAEEETPAAEEPKAEAETPAEEAAEPAAEEASETPAEEEAEEGSEYQAPEGESHADLVNRYHEAISYGDIQQANELYMQLQDHRYQENKFRAGKEAVEEADAREHLAVAKAMAAKHPELAEDGVAANKVLALAEVYRGEGMKPAAALKQAVADLYPENITGTSAPEVPPAEEEAPAAEAAPAEATAAEEEEAASGDTEASEPIADMAERAVKKRSIAEVPAASARNEPEPPPAKPTRSSAIVDMKRARGQL